MAEDCYALGATSRIIASELASLTWAKNRRKVSIYLVKGSFVIQLINQICVFEGYIFFFFNGLYA